MKNCSPFLRLGESVGGDRELRLWACTNARDVRSLVSTGIGGATVTNKCSYFGICNYFKCISEKGIVGLLVDSSDLNLSNLKKKKRFVK